MKKVSRKFLLLLILQHRQLTSQNVQNHFDNNKILLHDLDFSGSDLKGIHQNDFELFEFSNCKLNNAQLDRVGLAYFIKYMREQKITYNDLDVSGSNLGKKLILSPDIGIACNISINLTGLNLRNFIFSNCMLEGTVFEDSDIAGAKFINVEHISPAQFAFCLNFDKAIFSSDPSADSKFKAEIKKINVKGKPQEKPFNSFANFKLAHMFDPADDNFKRIEDTPGKIKTS